MSFGSVLEAIVSLNNNRRQRTAKTEKFLATTGSKMEGVKSHRIPSKEELQILRKRISQENKKRQKKILLITSIIMVICLLTFLYFMF